MLLNICI